MAPGSFLQSDAVFEIFSDMRIEVDCVDADFLSRLVILLGQRAEKQCPVYEPRVQEIG